MIYDTIFMRTYPHSFSLNMETRSVMRLCLRSRFDWLKAEPAAILFGLDSVLLERMRFDASLQITFGFFFVSSSPANLDLHLATVECLFDAHSAALRVRKFAHVSECQFDGLAENLLAFALETLHVLDHEPLHVALL